MEIKKLIYDHDVDTLLNDVWDKIFVKIYKGEDNIEITDDMLAIILNIFYYGLGQRFVKLMEKEGWDDKVFSHMVNEFDNSLRKTIFIYTSVNVEEL